MNIIVLALTGFGVLFLAAVVAGSTLYMAYNGELEPTTAWVCAGAVVILCLDALKNIVGMLL